MGRVRILLADDHTVVRQGLRKVLEERPEWEVVAEAGDGREAVRQAEQHKPDVAILDVAMPLLNGIETTRQIGKRSPATRVLVLTMHADEAYVTQILQAGAVGYLLKDSPGEELVKAIHTIHEGKAALPELMGARVMDLLAEQSREETSLSPANKLTARELEILELIQQGATDRVIADRLGLSVKTVNTHVGHILLKLGEPNRAMAVQKAVTLGLLKTFE